MKWNEKDHPRVPGGKSGGGRFTDGDDDYEEEVDWSEDGSIGGVAARKASDTIPQAVQFGVDVNPNQWWGVKDGIVVKSNAHSLYDAGHEGLAKKLHLNSSSDFDIRGYTGTIRRGRPGEGLDVVVFYDVTGKSKFFMDKYYSLLDRKLGMPKSYVIYGAENISNAKIWDGST